MFQDVFLTLGIWPWRDLDREQATSARTSGTRLWWSLSAILHGSLVETCLVGHNQKHKKRWAAMCPGHWGEADGGNIVTSVYRL